VRRKANAVFVLTEVSEPTHVLGYYTLCAMAISQGDVPEAARKHVPRYPLVSATLIGRLAVAKDVRDSGSGPCSTRWTRLRPASTRPTGSCGCPTRFGWCCQCAWRQGALSDHDHAP
jgi:hypothetical protein